jgi:hypothetical protein
VTRKLERFEIEKSSTLVTLADGWYKTVCGGVENALVRLDKLWFLVDFEVIGTKGKEECPMILGRPFLETSKANIDVVEGRITLSKNSKKITFGQSKIEKKEEIDECCLIIG